MKENEIIEKHLRSIKKVDAPHFLLTRIEAKINSNQKNIVSTKKIAVGLAFTIALILGNVIFMQQSNTKITNSEISIFESMNIVTSNQLYNE